MDNFEKYQYSNVWGIRNRSDLGTLKGLVGIKNDKFLISSDKTFDAVSWVTEMWIRDRKVTLSQFSDGFPCVRLAHFLFNSGERRSLTVYSTRGKAAPL